MDDVTLRVGQVRASTANLLAWLDELALSDEDVRADSLLPGWTRGHVLAHIAQNADAIARTLAGAVRGEVVERYPDGDAGRDAAITAAAAGPAAALVSEIHAACDRLDRLWGAVTEAGAWDRRTSGGSLAADWPHRRWREVEIHRVDLAAGYTPDQWPAEFVTYLLDVTAASLADRAGSAISVRVTDHDVVLRAGDGDPTTIEAPGWAVAAWLAGRAEVAGELASAPALSAWI